MGAGTVRRKTDRERGRWLGGVGLSTSLKLLKKGENAFYHI